jgi:ubiquinone/menaquinone biosynthesis C-methylase UbiE
VDAANNISKAAAVPLAPPRVPHYLEEVYWWAYVHPRSVQVFERDWLVNAILFGNYARLREHALAALVGPEGGGGGGVGGRTLQVGCVYGNLTSQLVRRLQRESRLEVVDILPVQLDNLHAKLARHGVHERVLLTQADASALPHSDASVDRALLFFLLHEQPAAARSATLAEALRVVKPGGRVVIVDYHCPLRWHPLRPLMRAIFARLEPYASDLWAAEVESMLPVGVRPRQAHKRTFFGGLYQALVWTR